MSLDIKKLQNAREIGSGIIQARCPACAKNDSDKAGEHLRVYPDGKFGCCVHPKDSEHRRQIFALVGEGRRTFSRSFKMRVATTQQASLPLQSVAGSLTHFLGTLGTATSNSKNNPSGLDSLGTLGTPISNSDTTCKQASQTSQEKEDVNFGTLGTPFSNPRAYAREDKYTHVCDTRYAHMCKDWETGVPSVPKPKLPHLLADGTLVIPFDSPERYHWWKGGQSITATRQEILERNNSYDSLF